MTSKRPENIHRHGDSDGRPSSSPVGPEQRPSSVQHDLERTKADFIACQKSYKDACCERRFGEAAVHHRKIIGLLKQLFVRSFSFAAQIEAELRQATILLMCDTIEDVDRSLFPSLEELNQQRSRQHGSNAMAWGVLCAKVGFLYMRSLDKEDLTKATTYLNQSLRSLVEVKPVPTEHILPVAQCLADLYDFTTGDALSAEGMTKWLGQAIGPERVHKLAIGHISRAIKWGQKNGFVLDKRQFDVAAMESAIKQNESGHMEAMLTWTERTHPSGTVSSKLLFAAAEARSMAMCQVLFEHQANADAIDDTGKTALHHCVSRGPAKDQSSRREVLKIANLLLNKSPTLLDRQDFAGKTALYVACEAGYVDMVSFLVGVDANTNLAENNAQTPLYMACERGLRPVVKSLVEKAKDLDINARGPGGQTPLTAAVQYAAAHAEGRLVVEMLLKQGADPSVEDNAGKTALHYVGGIWASDLKAALKSAKHKSATASSKLSDHANISFANSSSVDSIHKPSRPPSTRSSMFSKIMQPRNRSGNSSLFSPSRTSLDTASIAPGSVFSNDMSSRRTSITVPSIYEFENDPQLVSTVGTAAGVSMRQPVTLKGKFVPMPQTTERRAPKGDEHDAFKEAVTTSDTTRPAGRGLEVEGDLNAAELPVGSQASSNSAVGIHNDESVSFTGTQHVRNSIDSNRSSTESAWDTPSDSEEASYDGDQSPLEVRTYNLPIRSQHEGTRERPAGREAERDGSFDGTSSIPTPPSDPYLGAGSRKANTRQGSGSGSRGAQVLDAAQSAGSEQKRQVLLACPFAKKDPIEYEHCHKYELKEIKHVKQHLKRCHLISYCARCRVSFANQLALERHHRDDDACERSDRPVPEGMTLEQHEILKPRTNHKLSLEEQWYFIWDVLFPGRERPATPYKDEFVNLTEFHRIYRDYRDNQIPTLAANVLHEMGIATTITHDQAVALMRTSLMGFANMLQGSGLVGQHDTSTDRAGQSRSTSVTDGPSQSPAPRMSSFESVPGQLTPDSSGHPAHQSSPQSTRFSDDCYDSLQPIEEMSSGSSDVRQGSVGVAQETAPISNAPLQGPSQVLPLQQGVSFHQPEWDNSAYSMQPSSTTYGPLSGMAAWHHEPVFDQSATNPLYSTDQLFNMDPTSMEHIINFDVNMDLDMVNAPATAQTSTGPDYFPTQHNFQGHPLSSDPYMSGGQAPTQYQHVPQAEQGILFSPTSQPPGNGQQHPWNMR